MTEAATRRQTTLANREQILSYQLAEAVTRNAAVVSAMGMLPAVTKRRREMNGGALAALRRASERARHYGVHEVCPPFVQIGILGVGALLVLRGQLTAGGMVAASILLSRALAPVEMAMSVRRNFAATCLAHGRLKKHLEDFRVQRCALGLPAPEAHVRVESVVYCAPGSGRLISSGVSFELEPNEVIDCSDPLEAEKARFAVCSWALARRRPERYDWTARNSALEPNPVGQTHWLRPRTFELFSGTISENIAPHGPGRGQASSRLQSSAMRTT